MQQKQLDGDANKYFLLSSGILSDYWMEQLHKLIKSVSVAKCITI